VAESNPAAAGAAAEDYDTVSNSARSVIIRSSQIKSISRVDFYNCIQFITEGNLFQRRCVILSGDDGDVDPLQLMTSAKNISSYLTERTLRSFFSIVEKITQRGLMLNCWMLSTLRVEPESVQKIFTELMECAAAPAAQNLKQAHRRRSPHTEDYSSKTLEAVIAAARARASAALAARSDEAVNLVIIDDPSRQFSGSLNPVIESPKEWYGEEFFAEAPLASSNGSIAAAIQYLERIPRHVDTQQCSICLGAVKLGKPNVCVTKCGHVFHMQGEGNNCVGLSAWIIHGGACPACSKNISK
jgi:hypothetical protein